MDWYKFHVSDYRDATWHLTLAEHGAYRLLIDHYMLHEKALPDNDRALASIIGVGPDEWAEIAPIVREKFRPHNGRLYHSRCDAEINAMSRRRENQKERNERYLNNLKDKRVTDASVIEPEETRLDDTRHDTTRDTLSTDRERGHASASRGSRLPDDWTPTERDVIFAVEKGYDPPEVEAIADEFKDYWTAKTGQQATKKDWHATWRNWVRREKTIPRKRTSQGGTMEAAQRVLDRMKGGQS